MPRVSRSRVKTITINFDDGGDITLDVNESVFSTEGAEQFQWQIKEAEIRASRISTLQKRAAATEDDEVYSKATAELEELKKAPTSVRVMAGYLSKLVRRFHDYYLTEEDQAAGRALESDEESLLKADPNELGLIVAKIHEKLSIGEAEKKESSETLPASSVIPNQEKERLQPGTPATS